jgi:hypothetical protein
MSYVQTSSSRDRAGRPSDPEQQGTAHEVRASLLVIRFGHWISDVTDDQLRLFLIPVGVLATSGEL